MRSVTRHRAALLTAAAIGLVLTGCGSDSFDPATAQPCDFLTEENLDEHGFVTRDLDDLTVVSTDLTDVDTTACAFTKKPGWSDSVPYVIVGYLDQSAADLAGTLDLDETTGYGDLVQYRNQAELEPTGASTCQLVGTGEDGSSVLYEFGVDTTWVEFAVEPPDHPCDYVVEFTQTIPPRMGLDS